MGLLSSLRRRLSARVKVMIGSTLSWAGFTSSGGIGSGFGCYDQRDDEAWLRAYQRTSEVRAPVNRIAEDVASVRVSLRRKLGGAVSIDGRVPSEEITEDNADGLQLRLLQLLRRPNSGMTWWQFVHLIVVWREMTGKAPILIEWENVRVDGMRKRIPKALWPIPPHRVTQMPSERDPRFGVRTKKGVKYYDPGDFIWLNVLDVLDPYGPGCGAAQAVDDEVSQIYHAGVYNNNFYRQGAHLGKVVGIKNMSKDVREKLENDWNTRYTGVHNAHRTLFLPTEGLSVVDMGTSHRELDFTATLQMLADRCRFNWCMPPEQVGDVRNSNRATAQASALIHQANNLCPRVLWLADGFNTYLVPLYGMPEVYIHFDNPVQQTEELLHTALTEGYQAGTVTRDEWRQGHKMDPLGDPWGPQLSFPLNMGSASLSDQPQSGADMAAAAKAIGELENALLQTVHRRDQKHRRGEEARNGACLHPGR